MPLVRLPMALTALNPETLNLTAPNFKAPNLKAPRLKAPETKGRLPGLKAVYRDFEDWMPVVILGNLSAAHIHLQ